MGSGGGGGGGGWGEEGGGGGGAGTRVERKREKAIRFHDENPPPVIALHKINEHL